MNDERVDCDEPNFGTPTFGPEETALKSRFETSLPPIPPVHVELLMQLAAAQDSEPVAVPRDSDGSRRAGVNTYRWLTLAGLAGLVFLVVTFFKPAPQSGFGFEVVQERIDQVQSVQYMSIRTEPRYMAAQRFAEGEGDEQHYVNGLKEPEYTKYMILGKHRQRYEHITKGGVYVSDMLEGVSISLDLKARTYDVLHRSITVDGNGKQVAQREMKANPEVDFYRQIKQVPVDASLERIGHAVVDGRNAAGFRRVTKSNLETWKRTWWIDSETLLPLRIEISFRSQNPMIGENDFVLTGFVFDEPLDESLFSVSPDGFTELAPADVIAIDPYANQPEASSQESDESDESDGNKR